VSEPGDVPKHLRDERLALMAVYFMCGAIFASWAGRIPQLQEHLSLSDGQLGISMFCLAIGCLIAMPSSGALAARFHSARMTVLFSLASCAALILLPLPSTWLLFSLALVLFGFAMGGMDVCMNAHAVQVERAFERTLMGSFHAMFSVGAMFGAGFSGLVAGFAVPPWQHFLLVFAVFLAVTIVLSRFLQSTEMEDKEKKPLFVIPDRHIVVLSLVAFCAFIGEGAIADWSAVYLKHELGTSDSFAALGFSVFCLAMSTCRFLGDRIIDRLGVKRILLLGGILAGSGIAGGLLFPIPLVVLAFYLLAGVGFSCMVPVAFSAAGKNKFVAPSVGIAGVATAGYFGFVIAPPIIGLLADHVTLRNALWLPALLSFAVSLLAPYSIEKAR
jgi:MFS family permease